MLKTPQVLISSICTMTGAQATYLLADRGVFNQPVVSHQAVGSCTSQITSVLILYMQSPALTRVLSYQHSDKCLQALLAALPAAGEYSA